MRDLANVLSAITVGSPRSRRGYIAVKIILVDDDKDFCRTRPAFDTEYCRLVCRVLACLPCWKLESTLWLTVVYYSHVQPDPRTNLGNCSSIFHEIDTHPLCKLQYWATAL